MTQFTKYGRYGNGYVTNTRARKILAARVKLTLDAQLGRESSPAVKRLAGMEVPLSIESKHLAKHVRKDAGAPKATDIRGVARESVPPNAVDSGPKVSIDRKPAEPAGETTPGRATEGFPMESVDMLPVSAASRTASVSVRTAKEEHSGNVTLYLPKDLNQWLREFHDSSVWSYPDIVLDAISWASSEFSRIFAREDCSVPAGDLFGRAPALLRKPKSPGERSTRTVRFHKDDMQVIMRLAGEQTAGNRNAFFIEVLAAYRDHLIRSSVATID